MRNFQDAEEVLAATLPGYQSRLPQQMLAESIHAAFEGGDRHLIAEAGTGTGKSLAYLIEAILSGKRVIVSTATKALQDQLAIKDIPFLEANLGIPFSWTVLKGRGNYLCVDRALASSGVASLRQIVEYVERAQAEGGEEGFSGERDAFPFTIPDKDWREVCSDKDDCKECGGRADFWERPCYAHLARAKARRSNLVVVNHSLLFSDLQIRKRSRGHADMLDIYETVVLDEAHEIESYASNALGDRLTEGTFTYTFGQVRNRAQEFGFLDVVEPLLIDANAAVMALWEKLAPGRLRSAEMSEHSDVWMGVYDALVGVGDAWGKNWRKVYSGRGLSKSESKRGKRVTNDINGLVERVGDFIAEDWSTMVRFVEEERRQRKGRRYETVKVLRMLPINVGRFLRELLFDRESVAEPIGPSVTAVLVSATLAVNGSMSYIAGRLGIDDYDELDVGTSFDYQVQARLYVPRDLPEPTPANRAAWSNLMRSTVYDLVRVSDGRALLLFTSFREMQATYEALADRLPYTCLRQGDAPTRDLARRFAEEVDSVLFATRSFFTGVDFQGETCSLVVIDKLPFPVPSDPLVEARQEEIEDAGGNTFRDYAIPEMVLPLKQGFGRLIRHTEDYGVVAILDPRLVTKGYGKSILRSLPDAPVTTDFGDVESFFMEHGTVEPAAV